MDSVLSMFSVFPIVSAVVCSFILVYTLKKGEKNKKLLSFELVIACCFIWSIGQFLEYSTSDLILLSYYTKIIHTAVALIGTVCLLFSLYYTENIFIYKYKKFIPFFFIIPVFIFITIVTNDYHRYYFVIYQNLANKPSINIELGPFFWFIYTYTIVFVIIAIGVIIRSALKGNRKVRKQMLFIALVMLFPVTINVIEIIISKIINWNGYPFDFTPTSFSFSCLFVFFAVFRYNFLDIMPIAQKMIFDHLEHGTIVYKQNGKLVKYNTSFEKNFKHYFDAESDINTYPKLCSVLKQSVQRIDNDEIFIDVALELENTKDITGEIALKSRKTEELSVYEMHVQSIFNSSNNYLGRIITFHDITKYKILVDDVNKKNNQLTDMNEKLLDLNKQLNENIKLTEELAISDERNRIARELHDSIGHTLMLIIMLMKSVKIEYDKNPDDSKSKVSEAISIAEDGFREIKRLINGFLSDDINNRNIIYNLENLFNDVRRLGVIINFSVIGEEYFNHMKYLGMNIKITDTVYKISKEAITNSIRHGKATSINVILKYIQDSVNIYVIDNGKGCKEIKEGLGLNGMKERVKAVHGNIVYGSDGESGFNIHAQLPVGGENDKSIVGR